MEEVLSTLRKISRKKAKKEIMELFAKEGGLHYFDIADKLRLDLEFVVDICDELVNEGKIGSVKSTVYYCTKCNKEHTNASKIYKKHKEYAE